VTLEIHEFSNIEDIYEKCKGWVNEFLAFGSLGRKGFEEDFPKAFDSQTPSVTTNALHIEYPFCPNVKRNAASPYFLSKLS
jgi:hypothetical protein